MCSRAFVFCFACALAAVLISLGLSTRSFAHLSEETLPAEEMPTVPTATPDDADATPASTDTTTPAAAPIPSPSTAPAPSPTPGLPPLTSGENVDPSGAPMGEPPSPDLGAVPTLQVSEAPLTDLIANASNPARAASLRITEQARQDLFDGKAQNAIQVLAQAVSIDPSDPYPYFYLGRAYMMRKDYRQALIFLQRAEIGLASDPVWLGETLSFEGVCYEQSGNIADATLAYKRALDASPNNLMARAGYGRLASTAELEATPAPSAATLPEVAPPPQMPAPGTAPSEPPPPVAVPPGGQ